MKAQWIGLAAVTMVAAALLAAGQTTGSQQAGIDAALLAKANGGDVAAQVAVGECYAEGNKGVARDYKLAAEWFKKAADQGDVGAQGTLGTLYSMGQGFEQNYVEAYYWLDLAAAVKGPRQEQYAANRQMIGIHITAEELAGIQDRETAWKAAHPR